ncbi:MAG: extracellular solute-binding protein [Chloroflexi bacterium]|nr:extracellular solute-binding protein [Chloroflexota bacterium]
MCIFILAACSFQPGPAPATSPPTAVTAEPTATTAASPEPNKSPLPQTPVAPATQTLRLWFPPQLAPTNDDAAGRQLLTQLQAFEDSHPGWQIEVRAKKLTGQGGLLDSLQTTLQSAPGISPDVIVADGPTLTNAAPFLQTLTEHFGEAELADFYPFALQAARIDNQLLGLPFAADALGLAYSTNVYVTPPLAWVDLNTGAGPIWLPLNDPTALVTLQQYVALGGSLTDETGKPAINSTVLAQVLTYYQFLQVNDLLSIGSLESVNTADTWLAYRESRATSAAAYASTYFAERDRVAATGYTLLPTREGNSLTFASQWNYALVAADPTRQSMALELMRWLTAPDNLSAWTLEAQLLPTRGAALTQWPDPALRAIAGEAVTAAQPLPSSTLLGVLGPPITLAVQSVLSGQATPEVAAEAAAQTIAGR